MKINHKHICILCLYNKSPHTYTYIYVWGDLFIEISSCGYGDLEVHDLPSASWRTRKTGGIIQPESKGLRIGGWWCMSCYKWENRNRSTNVQMQESMAVSVEAERENLHFLCLVVLFRPSADWTMPTCIGEDDLLYSVYWFRANLFLRHLHRCAQKQCFPSYLSTL